MHTAQEETSRVGFWERRTGWSFLKKFLFLEPLPGGSRWAAAFGSLLLFAFVLQVVTGILLAMYYSPSVDSAWPSVKFIQEEVPLGDFIRAVHHWGSSAMVILLLVHLIQVFVWGAYKKPREFTWMVGVILLFITLGLAFTGYLLPWDERAYWATKVGLSIVGTTPAIGDDLKTALQGGSQLGNLTLTRFFGLHVFVLPGLLILLVVVHLYLFRLHGVTPPWWQSAEQLKACEEPFWPRQVLKDAIVWLVFLVALGWWAWQQPAPLEAQADPSRHYEARPEWYFMFFFQILRYFEGPAEVVGTFVLPLLFFLVLFFWPFLDRNPQRDPRRRPVALGLLTGGSLGLVGLTIFALATDVRMHEPMEGTAETSAPKESADPFQRADVAKVYGANCAVCHGVEGTGKQIRLVMPTIPDFTSLAWQKSQTNLEIVYRILDGNEPLMPGYKNKLTEQQILALAIYVRAFEISAHSSGVPEPAPPPIVAQMSPTQIYGGYCLGCHDKDGSGKVARTAMTDLPDLTDPKWWDKHEDAELKKSILLGKGKFMLPMKDKLSGADAEKVVAFLRKFSGGKQVVKVGPEPPLVEPPKTKPEVVPDVPPDIKPPPEDTSERIRVATVLYKQYCLVCHGTDGKGSDMKSALSTMPDFSSHTWQAGVSKAQLAAGILDGKGTMMPAFRGKVSEDQAQDLAAYVRAFGPIKEAPGKIPASDFEQRFQELQVQWNELQKQIQQLKKTPPK
jgi:quinol-cytochrome oxidoreductase complex cytochrome b subunit/cytochrome c